MKTRVYYGQYSLKHWINLMRKRNIVLPEYQRSFVWEEDDIKRLIKSFNDGQFVQPITIAQSLSKEGEVINIILDGQQRLTSILLYDLGRFPKKENFQEVISLEENNTNVSNNKKKKRTRIEWRFEKLLSEYKDEEYKEFKIEPEGNDKDVFLNNHFLGFSYIVPECNECNEINSYYSTLFRKINYYGEVLTPLECRNSLYYMDSEIKNYFEGKINDDTNVLHNIKTPGNNTNIDIIRYLSNLSLYSVLEKDKKEDEFKFNTDEKFYTDYVFHILGQETEYYDFKEFNFKTTLEEGWKASYKRIYEFIEQYLINEFRNDLANTSWYEIDFWLSGLIYCNLFKGKVVTSKDDKELFDDIKAEIERTKELRTLFGKFEEINFYEPLEQIYAKEEFKILKEIYDKELNNHVSCVFDLLSRRDDFKKELSKLNDKIKEESRSVLQKRIDIEKTIKGANELIEEIGNNKQKSIQNLSEILPYISKFQELNQSYQKSKEIIGKLKKEQKEKERNLTNEITDLNSKINMHIFSIAKREYKKTSTYEYVVKKSIEIYSKYVQE